MTVNSQSLSKEQVLIVGCGDIGTRFAKILPDSFVVTGLRRNPPANTAYLRYQTCDVTDPQQLDSILKQSAFDVILVTMTPSAATDAGYAQAYVQTCKNLTASLKAHQRKPRLLVFVSSTGVYGQNDGGWVDENSPTEPDSFSGKRLLEAEQVILDGGFDSTVVRFSGIYGPGRYRLLDQVLQGRAQLSLQMTNRIHVDDCAAVIAHLVGLRQALDAVYIASDSTAASMAEVVTWLAQQLGVVISVPPESIAELGNKGSNKCCSNRRLLASGFVLRYSGYREGYQELIRDKLKHI